MKKLSTFIAVAVIALGALAAFASITFDSETGIGFVGKGDVQLTFGWNNAQLQQNAANVNFKFFQSSVVVTEVSWVCTNSNNENVQQRERKTTTTASMSAVFDSIARVKNQITGFNLNGYDGTPVITSSSHSSGNPLNSCPSGPWSLTTPAGDPEVISETTLGDGFLICNGNDCRTPVVPTPTPTP